MPDRFTYIIHLYTWFLLGQFVGKYTVRPIDPSWYTVMQLV